MVHGMDWGKGVKVIYRRRLGDKTIRHWRCCLNSQYVLWISAYLLRLLVSLYLARCRWLLWYTIWKQLGKNLLASPNYVCVWINSWTMAPVTQSAMVIEIYDAWFDRYTLAPFTQGPPYRPSGVSSRFCIPGCSSAIGRWKWCQERTMKEKAKKTTISVGHPTTFGC